MTHHIDKTTFYNIYIIIFLYYLLKKYFIFYL